MKNLITLLILVAAGIAIWWYPRHNAREAVFLLEDAMKKQEAYFEKNKKYARTLKDLDITLPGAIKDFKCEKGVSCVSNDRFNLVLVFDSAKEFGLGIESKKNKKCLLFMGTNKGKKGNLCVASTDECRKFCKYSGGSLMTEGLGISIFEIDPAPKGPEVIIKPLIMKMYELKLQNEAKKSAAAGGTAK